MKTTVGILFAAALGLLLAAGIPFAGTSTAHAGGGCGCECGYPQSAGKAGAMHHRGAGMQDNAAGGGGHMHGHGGHMGGHPGRTGDTPDRMESHMKDIRDTILKLRAAEARMEAAKEKDDAGFRAAALEHDRLLTDLQENHLKHMEGMMAMRGSCGGMKK